MSNYTQKQEWERWTCRCGIPRKIRNKIKPCKVCNQFPKKKEIETAKKSRLTRHL